MLVDRFIALSVDIQHQVIEEMTELQLILVDYVTIFRQINKRMHVKKMHVRACDVEYIL